MIQRFFIAASCCVFALPAFASVGEVSELQGEAQAKRGANAIPLSVGKAIEADDVIVTGDHSAITITFEDDSVFSLGTNSQMTIDEFVYDPNAMDNRAKINITKGAFRFLSGRLAKQNPENMTYETPVGAIGIRGSEAFGEVKPNGMTVIGMTECCVDLISKTGKTELDTSNTFSKVNHSYHPPVAPAQCDAAWLNKVGRDLGVSDDDRLYAHATNLKEAFTLGQYHLNLRYRFEMVDQAGFADSAVASTLRQALDFKTATYQGMSAFVEVENVTQIGEGRYNDTFNGKAYPVIWDTDVTELNQLYIAYEGVFPTHLAIGRQKLAYDNQRFVGSVGFRQDTQSFDALSVHDHHFKGVDLRYAYVDRVNRIFPEGTPTGRFNSDSHLFNLHLTNQDWGNLTTYGYLIDLEEAPMLSSQTYGLRFTADRALPRDWHLGYALEYARQSDYGGNTMNYDADYYHAQADLRRKHWQFGVGYEVLGSDGGIASVTTPLATLHAHNGAADEFLITPLTGLQDIYVSISYVHHNDNEWLNGMRHAISYHDYSADQGGMDYGQEWNFSTRQDFLKHYAIELKYADYEADSYSTDTKKLWLSLIGRF